MLDRFRELGEIGLERAVRMSRPLASFSTWPATSPSMPDRLSASLPRSASSARVRMLRPSESLPTWPATICVDGRLGLVELVQVVAQRAGQVFAAGMQPAQLAFERGVDAGARLGNPAQVLLDGLGDQGAAFRQLLHVLADRAVDRGAAFGEFLQVGVQGRGHAVAAFGELAAVVLDGLVDAGACLGEPLDVGVEGARHDVARGIEAAGEIAGARFEHGRGRIDDVGHLGADLGLALVDHGGKVLAAVGEGRGDLAGALDQRLVDLAGARLERGVELLRAGVERFGAGLELADQRLAAFGERPFDVVQPVFELGVELARRRRRAARPCRWCARRACRRANG